VVFDSTGSWRVNKWTTAAEATCGTGTCSVNPGIPLPPGLSKWYIRAANYCVFSPWSAGMDFSVPSLPSPADKPVLRLPHDTIHTNKPTYAWDAVPCADYYWLVANDSTGFWPVNRWYSTADADCSAGACSAKPGILLPPGNYDWYLLPWNYAGFGGLGGPMSFTVP
jgi:hypothetical protein